MLTPKLLSRAKDNGLYKNTKIEAIEAIEAKEWQANKCITESCVTKETPGYRYETPEMKWWDTYYYILLVDGLANWPSKHANSNVFRWYGLGTSRSNSRQLARSISQTWYKDRSQISCSITTEELVPSVQFSKRGLTASPYDWSVKMNLPLSV